MSQLYHRWGYYRILCLQPQIRNLAFYVYLGSASVTSGDKMPGNVCQWRLTGSDVGAVCLRLRRQHDVLVIVQERVRGIAKRASTTLVVCLSPIKRGFPVSFTDSSMISSINTR